MLQQPVLQQQEWLLNRIRAAESTRFGRDHAFSEIRNIAEFRSRVPISEYAYFEPYIDAVAAGQTEALIPAQEKLLRFTITTGTTGKPKLNPVTNVWMKQYQLAWSLWGMKLFADHPDYLGKLMLQMAGTWNMGTTAGGYSISMISALLARTQSPFLRPFYAIPSELNDIPDPITRYYTVLRLCLDAPIGWILLMNPGTLLRLAQVGDQFSELLIRDLREGTLTDTLEIPDSVRQTLQKRVSRKKPAAAKKLEQIVRKTGHLYPKDYWENPVISCWLGGTAGYQSKSIGDYFGPSPLRDMGLVSSEGRHTIPLEDGTPSGVPSLVSGFFEYLPIAEAGRSSPVVVDGPDLEVGADYYLVFTSAAGYYRFHLGDIVRCTGFIGQTPLLEFIQKGGRIGDLEGEKVTEHQIVMAYERAATELNLAPGLLTAVPVRLEEEHPRYDFFLEIGSLPDESLAPRLLEAIDRELAALNFLWRARRKEGVLTAPRMLLLPTGTWENYIRQVGQERGTGDYQYKHPALVVDQKWAEPFARQAVAIHLGQPVPG
ncbi:MAG: GH3 auxin-responsive promoter family protein [Planctomycetaceae bacterium]|nr:GH3 auxin-responsive promoter family protein [Planctomycetaceae bacterium]